MKVKLLRRHGRNRAGKTYDYAESTGQWLIDNGFGVAARDEAKADSRSDSRTEPKAETESKAEESVTVSKPDSRTRRRA